MPLRQVAPGIAIDLEKVEGVERGKDGAAIAFIKGRGYATEIDYDLLITIINEVSSREELEETQPVPIPTTSDSQFAG